MSDPQEDEVKTLGTTSMAAGAALVPEESPAEEAAETLAEEAAEDAAEACPECGATMVDGVCPECGYAPGAMKSLTIAYGGTAKSLPDDPYRVRTKGIVWGGHDLEGDQFVQGETDLGAARSFVGMPVFWDHSEYVQNNPIKSQIGTVVYADEDDQGINFEIELDRSKRYVDDIKALERAGMLGSSTGAIDYLIKRRRGKLKRWIIGEISLTPEPMEPRTHAAIGAKSIASADVAPQSQEDTPMGEPQPTTAEPGADVAQRLTGQIEALSADIKTLRDANESQAKGFGTAIQSVRTDLDTLQSMPAVQQRAAAIEVDVPTDATPAVEQRYHNMKSLFLPGGRARMTERYPEGVFGGYVKAVIDAKTSLDRSSDARKALRDVYGITGEEEGAKTLGTQAGTSGAYLIAEQFVPSLMAVAQQKDALYGRAMVIPADGGEIVIPALDYSGSFTAGQSQYYAGVSISWGDDDSQPALTTPSFGQVRLKTNALKARVRVKNALLQRSAITIDAVLTSILGGAIGWARDYAMIRGSGVGQPLGALYAPACIDSGGTTLDAATVEAMLGRTIPERQDNYIWLIHALRRPDVMALQQTNNTLVTFMPDLRGKPQTTLLGLPIVYTDKLPYTSGASNAADSVLLIDPSMIVAAEYQGIALAVSDQVRFEDDETVFRVILSMDSQPWLKTTIAIGSGAADNVSGFVRL